MTLTPRQKAARKGVRTRAANAAYMKRWMEVDRPAHLATVSLINESLSMSNVRVRFVGGGGWAKLAKGSGEGRLVKVLGTGLSWRVLADGYKHPQNWHASYWEVIR